MAKKPSAMEMLQQRREHLFVGRDEEREAFQRNFTRALRDQYLIFAIYGQAGIGKSFLVDHYRRIAAENDALTALTNEAETGGVRERSIVQAMARLAKQLADAGAPLEAFNEQHAEYRDSVLQIEADPKAPPGLFGRFARAAARAVTSGVKATPLGAAGEGFLTEFGVHEDRVIDWTEAGGRYLAQ